MTLEPVQVLSEKHWRVFLEQSTDALALLDREGVILYESSNVQNILGYRAEELVGRRAFEFVHPADKRAAEEAFNQNLTHPRQRYTTQTRFLRKDGSVCWVEANIANWLDDPELGAVLVSYHDISERKKAQEALAANLKLQEQLEKTASTVSGMLHTFKIDADGKASMPYASPTIADVYGLKAEDVAEDASPIFDLIDPRDKLEVDAQIRASARDMTPWRAKFRIHHPTKGLRWIDGHSTPVREADGSLLWHGFIQDITERRQAEEALRLSNERFTELANNIPEMFWVLDPVTQKSLYVSPAFEDIMGQSIERLEQLPNGFLGALLPEDLPILLHARSQERIGLKTDIQYRIIRPDGSIRWLHDKASPIYDENGIVVRVVGIASDLTEQVAAENRLLESEARFRQMAENIQEVFWMFDNQQQKLVYLSPAYEKIWGRSIESSYRDTRQYIEAIHPEDRGIMFAALARQARGESTEMEYRIMRPDGSVSWIHDRSFPIFGAKGEIVRTTGIATDITERKLAEAAARQSEEKYQHELLELNRSLEERVQERTAEVQDLYENAPTGYHSLDANGKFVRINQTELNWLGYPRDELIGKPFPFILAPNSQRTFDANFHEFKSSGRIFNLEYELVRKDGSTFPVSLNSIAIYDAQGRYLASRSTMFDDTERQKAIKALRDSEEQNRMLFEESPDAIILLENGKIVRANHAYAELARMPVAQIIGKSAEELGLVTNETSEYLRQAFTQSLQKQEGFAIAEYTMNCADGSRRELESRIFLLEIGGVLHILTTSRDISVRKQAEESLRRANIEMERALRMKDEFLASMSHELRTPLTGILGLSEALQFQTYGALNEKQLRALKNIENSGRHLLELINDILDLSKIEAGKLEMQFEICSLGEICQASLQLIRGVAQKKHQHVSFAMNPAVISVRADPRRLKQMLVNLLSNAVKFTPEGKALGLEVEGDQSRGLLKITIWDEGIGIKSEDLGRLFQPFVQLDSSLARQHSGTGLGLSLVQRMAALHGGRVEVQSEPGQGSRFTLVLPRQAEEGNPPPPKASAPVQPQAVADSVESPSEALPAPLVVVVDDQEINVETIAEFLESQHFRIATAANGIDFLEQFPRLRPDIILMDIQMPGMNGFEVIRHVRASPDAQLAATPVIAVTALAMPGDRERCLQAGANEYLSKPLSLQQTVQLIRAMLSPFSPSPTKK